MPQLKIIFEGREAIQNISSTTSASTTSMDGASTFSSQVTATVNTYPAQSFLSGVASSLVVQDLTYTADERGTTGDSITITYLGDGVAGAETVDVVGTGITVHMDPTAITGSTATQIKTAVDASAPASALIGVAITGTGSNVQAAAATTPLAGGVDSAVTPGSDTITIPGNNYVTGLKGRFTTTGTLPAGLALATDYYVISFGAILMSVASSLSNALAGIPVDITGQGSSGANNTFTPTALTGAAVQLEKSNDGFSWAVDGSPVSITGAGTYWVEKTNPTSIFMRLSFTATSGSFNAVALTVVKGLN